MERRRSGPRLLGGDPHQDVVGRRLGVLDDDVEVAVVVEDAGVEQLVFRLVRAPRRAVLGTSPRRGTRACGYLYEHLMYEWVGVLSR